MPSQGTQVYWHQLPEKVPPWRNAAELRACIESSKLVVPPSRQHVSFERGQADALLRHRASARRTARRGQRYRAVMWRRRLASHLELPRIHRGVVPEPNATPLKVVNLIMAHLHQPPVSVAEADAAVETVIDRFEMLTQQSQQTQPPEGQRGSRRQRQQSSLANATESVLSQPATQLTDGEGGTSASQGGPLPRRRGANMGSDPQSSLLLDVVSKLCEPRALQYQRFTRSYLSGLQYRVTSTDAVPHQRVVLLADRRDPFFVVLFGLTRRVTPEPFVAKSLEAAGIDPASSKQYQTRETPYTQVFCVAPVPVPWRRLRRRVSISAFHNEFTVAIVELDAELAAKQHGLAVPRQLLSNSEEELLSSTASANRSRTASIGAAGEVFQLRKRRRTVVLLGADEDEEEEGTSDSGTHTSPHARTEPTLATALDATAMEDDSERKWLAGEPIFPEPDAGDEAASQPDPLQRLPRTDVRDRRAQSKLRVWYRRLLSRGMTTDLMLRMHADHNDD